MKQFIRRYISMALFVLFGVSAFAGGKVEVADDVSNGTITGQANGTIVTLTVTPDPGYYIRKSDIVAEKTIMPVASSRRAFPLTDQLEIVGEDPEDLTQQRIYTVTLPSEEYDVLVHANFQLRGGKAEVNDAILNGTVVSSVDQLTVTVTVTPADGYYIRKEDVIVSKTFMPAATSRRAAPVADHLTLTGEDPDDLSQPRTYTAQLPGWEYSAYVDATFTKRKDITSAMVKLSASSFVYNGSDQQPVVTVTGLTEGKDYLLDFAGTSWSDVGIYSLTVTGRSTWKSVVTKTYTITKAPSEVTVAPEPLPLTYTGAPQTLIAAGDAIGGTLLYSLDNSSYQTPLPTGTAAGSYTVYYKVQGDSNHKDTEVKTVAVTIAKKAITISGIQAQDKVFDRTTVATLVYDAVVYGGIVDGDALTVTAKGTFVDANVGTNKEVTITEIVLDGQSIANYQLAENGQQTTVTAAITPKGIENATIADIPSAVYTGEGITPEVNVTLDDVQLISGTDFSVSYIDNINVGTATAIVTGQGNYRGTASQTFQITKASAAVTTAPTPLVLTYTGSAQALVEAGEAAGGTMQYSLDGEQFSADIPTSTATGSYTVYYKVQGDANHEDTEAQSVIAVIGKKEITISGIQAQDKVFDRTTVATLVYDAVVYGGIVDGDALTVTAKGTFVDANVGTNKEVTITEIVLDGQSIANYQLAENGQQTTVTAAITPKGIENATIADIPSAVYTGEGITPEVNVTLDDVQLISGTDFSVSYIDNINVGTATAIVTGQGNYRGTASQTFQITKASAAVTTAPTPLVLTYTGSAQALVEAGEAAGGTMQYSLDGEQFSADIPTSTATGSYTVYYKVQGDANHEDTEAQSVIAVIGKKEITISGIQAQDKVYDGTTAVTLSYDQVVFGGIADGDALTVTAKGTFADANVGTNKEVTITEIVLDGQSLANYQLADNGQQTTATATIAKKDIVISGITAQDKEYDGTIATTFVYDDVVYNGIVNGDALTVTATGTFTDANVGTNKAVTITELTLGGTSIANYQLAENGQQTTATAAITPKSIAMATISDIPDQAYTGEAITPEFIVTLDGVTLQSGADYTATFAGNVEVGTASVTVTGMGNYQGSVQKDFTIGRGLPVITLAPQPLALDYTGESQTLIEAGEAAGGTLVYSLDGELFTTELPVGTDAGVYTVCYKVQGDNNHIDTEVYTLKSSITPTLVDESGTKVDGDFIENEGGDIEVVINTLPENFWEDTSVIPNSVSDEEGNEYDVTQINADAFEEMPSDIIVVLPDGMSTTEGVTNVVNGDGTCETLDLTEVSGYNVSIDVEVETVVYEREVTGGSTTVCLPYDLPVPENTTAYALDDTDSEGVTLKECEGTLEANQPYVLVMDETSGASRRAGDDASSVVNLGTSNVTISCSAEEGSVVKNDFTLCGTVHSMTHEEGLAKKAYIMQADKTWRMTASSDPAMAKEQYLAPFQAYLLYTGEGELAEVSTTFESSTTGVLTVKFSTPKSSKDGWYDLMGRKLLSKPTKKGLYIYQGRKVNQ